MNVYTKQTKIWRTNKFSVNHLNQTQFTLFNEQIFLLIFWLNYMKIIVRRCASSLSVDDNKARTKY